MLRQFPSLTKNTYFFFSYFYVVKKGIKYGFKTVQKNWLETLFQEEKKPQYWDTELWIRSAEPK